MSLEGSVRSSLIAQGISSGTVVVGVSGGIDSVSLLHVLLSLSNQLNLTIVVAHANHGLRGHESDADEQFVVQLAQKLHVPWYAEHLPVRSHAVHLGKGVEAAARNLRYVFLSRVAEQHKARWVAVAHTANDVAETIIAHLARGSGIDGIVAHRSHRMLTENVTLVRPMLEIQRSQIKEYARIHNIEWREDSSNADLNYQRNHIRNTIIPGFINVFGPDVVLRLVRSAELLRQAQTIVDTAMLPATDQITPTSHGVALPLSTLKPLSTAEQTHVVRVAFQRAAGVAAGFSDTQRLLALVCAEPGSMATLSGSTSAWRERHAIVITTKSQESEPEIEVCGDGVFVAGEKALYVRTRSVEDTVFAFSPDEAYVDTESIHGSMVWRPWHHGERFVPFGMTESVLVADVLTNARVPTHLRRSIRVIADDQGILWVCGIRPAERTRITATTTFVTTFRIE